MHASALDDCLHRRFEAARLEDGWGNPPRQIAQLLDGGGCLGPRLGDEGGLGPIRLRQPRLRAPELHRECHQACLRAIVQIPLNAPQLFSLRVDDLAPTRREGIHLAPQRGAPRPRITERPKPQQAVQQPCGRNGPAWPERARAGQQPDHQHHQRERRGEIAHQREARNHQRAQPHHVNRERAQPGKPHPERPHRLTCAPSNQIPLQSAPRMPTTAT